MGASKTQQQEEEGSHGDVICLALNAVEREKLTWSSADSVNRKRKKASSLGHSLSRGRREREKKGDPALEKGTCFAPQKNIRTHTSHLKKRAPVMRWRHTFFAFSVLELSLSIPLSLHFLRWKPPFPGPSVREGGMFIWPRQPKNFSERVSPSNSLWPQRNKGN